MAKTSHVLAYIFLLTYGIFTAAQTTPTQSTRSLIVNVLDRNGNAVRDLTKASFQVKVNGHPAAILEAEYSLAPRRIVVLLDTSGSMMGGTEQSKKWRIAREAVEEFLTETPADVQVALVTFSSKVHDVIELSFDRSSIAAWLKRGSSQPPHIKGTTAFYDATLVAVKLLQPARQGDAIYAITDAGDNSSQTPPVNARRLLLQARVRLFLFLFSEPNPFEQDRVDSVIQLARETGGFVFGVIGKRGLHIFDFNYDDGESTRDRIKLYTRALNIQVNGFYTLQWDTPAPGKKLSKISLEVVDSKGKVNKDIAWTYQRVLPAPSM
jgi:Mg-chelatase subunit ChlD